MSEYGAFRLVANLKYGDLDTFLKRLEELAMIDAKMELMRRISSGRTAS
jgi:hypothetical protein